MPSGTTTILDGSSFAVSDRRGDIDASPDQPQGLFVRDTRFLSRWVLRLIGHELEALSTDDANYFSAQFFLYPPTGTIYEDPHLSVIRRRTVRDGLHEDLMVFSHSSQPTSVTLRLEADADFADLFEVKDALEKTGQHYRDIRHDALVLGYRRDRYVRETVIRPSAEAAIDERGLTFEVALDPHGSWQSCVEVEVSLGPAGHAVRTPRHRHGSVDDPVHNMDVGLQEWIDRAPQLVTSWDELGHIYLRSLVDLAALRFYPDVLPGASVPAAGLPWFMALFGRDSLITSYQVLPFVPELAESTLRVLATLQGRGVDAFRDEEPGKILHELREGELTRFGERPHSPYYGAADVTALWLILLDETERWTGNADLVRELEPNARAALAWIDGYGDRDGDGYVEYAPGMPDTGLENQCWKDSPNSIVFADGTNSTLPRATCEIQGYVFDAKRRTARIARELWGDPRLADRLEEEAESLKFRFNHDFWIGERGHYAIALDGQKRQVDSLTSNVGHLLWSGIVDADKSEAVMHHLMSDAMFSGWGVRTMSHDDGGYNPIGYHNGSVWPHDTAFVGAGLRRYGYAAQAARLTYALLEAATYSDWRLPEVFAGYDRRLTHVPVGYPTASSPQAWAAGAPLLLLRVLLGLDPVGPELRSDPVLPTEIASLTLSGIAGRWADGTTVRSVS